MLNLNADPKENVLLFSSALQLRGRTVALDSSKNIGRALMLSRSGMFDMVLLHLIRDSRAVVFSHRRKAERRTQSKEFNIAAAARDWQKLNLRLEKTFSASRNVSYLRICYEDLVVDPATTLKKVIKNCSLAWDENMLMFRARPHHSIEGNRMRLSGSSEIRKDDEYLQALSRLEWYSISGMTWRGLRRFGYKVRRGQHDSLHQNDTTLRSPSK